MSRRTSPSCTWRDVMASGNGHPPDVDVVFAFERVPLEGTIKQTEIALPTDDVIVRTTEEGGLGRWVEILVDPGGHGVLWGYAAIFRDDDEALSWLAGLDEPRAA